MQRREAVSVILAGLTSPFIIAADLPASDGIAQPDFAGIERQVSGRLGVCVTDLASHRSIGYRAGERFPMCSTFKLLLAGQILSMIDSRREQLSRVLPYTKTDLLDYAPVTRAHVGEGGMTVSALLAAALQYSDNTAANLLLRVAGGPPAVTSYVRDLGDGVTRLDRAEPDLNTAVPGDARDTTTPNAMADNLQALLVGNALTPKSRDLLNTWLLGNTTGVGKLRAGLPKDWR
ncbi:MAG: class A beta-lactamase, partial [Gemmatimonadaceae bacterium]